MFTEDYEKLTRGERTLFSEALNDLLYQCFIVRKSYDRKSRMFKADPDYLFIERHYSMFEDYLSYMDMDLTKSDEDGIIYITSGAEKNHLRIDTVTTLIVYALRSYYEDQIGKAPEETEVLMTYGSLNSLLQAFMAVGNGLRKHSSWHVVNRKRRVRPNGSAYILDRISLIRIVLIRYRIIIKIDFVLVSPI